MHCLSKCYKVVTNLQFTKKLSLRQVSLNSLLSSFRYRQHQTQHAVQLHCPGFSQGCDTPHPLGPPASPASPHIHQVGMLWDQMAQSLPERTIAIRTINPYIKLNCHIIANIILFWPTPKRTAFQFPKRA